MTDTDVLASPTCRETVRSRVSVPQSGKRAAKRYGHVEGGPTDALHRLFTVVDYLETRVEQLEGQVRELQAAADKFGLPVQRP